MRPRAMISSGAVLLFVLLTPVFHWAEEKYFHGTLDGQLHVDPEYLSMGLWSSAGIQQVDLPKKFVRSDRVFTGTFDLGNKPDLKIKGLLVQHADGQSVLYVDKDRNGRFSAADEVSFRPIASRFFESEAQFDIPLTGRYPQLPMVVRLYRSDIPNPVPSSRGDITVCYTPRPFVQGTVRLPSRPSLLVRYTYDLDKAEVNLAESLQYMDTDGDGKIDLLAEREVPEENSPMIFHINNLFVTTTAVDLNAQVFTLEAVPGTLYKRIDLRKGAVVPDFEFIDFDGKHRRLSEIGGKYRLIDFWGSWCAPCVADLKTEKELYARFHKRGLEIVGMNSDITVDKPKELLTKLGATWPEARLNSIRELVQKRFCITTWPTTILIDDTGKIVAVGDDATIDLEKTLTRLMPG